MFSLGLNMIIILPFLALLVVLFAMMVREEQKNMDNKHNAKYAFYYLLSLVALVFTALSVGMIVFSIIDKTIADALMNYRGIGDGSLKFGISALLIAAPIYYVTAIMIGKGLKSGELDKESPLRRWLTYFILLISSLIILGVFIVVMNNFLSGELTTRFILKALVVFVISGATFTYYLYEAKRATAGQSDQVIKIFGWASLAVVVVAFVSAWFFVESPQTARARRLDQTLINNINMIESAVNTYYTRHEALPEDIAAIQADDIYLDDRTLNDPETNEPIVYNRRGDRSFELCATFRLDSRDSVENSYYYPGDSKQHGAGYQCVSGSLYAEIDKIGR